MEVVNPLPAWESSYGRGYFAQLCGTCKRIKCLQLTNSELVQVEQRAAEEWKDIDESAKSLLLCMISTLFKLECGINGAHSMDEVGLGAYGQYKSLPGLDCTFPGFVQK